MIHHVAFCLDEIEAELDALDASRLDTATRSALAGHIAGMRLILEQSKAASRPASGKTSLAAQPTEPSDDLAMICGVGPADAALLADKGVRSFAAIAAWRREDILALGGGKVLLQRISGEGWIEQAAMLASGKQTFYIASQFARSAELALSAALALASTGTAIAAKVGSLSELDLAATRRAWKDDALPASAPGLRPTQGVSRNRIRPFVRAAAIGLLAIGLGSIDFARVASQASFASAEQSLDLR